MPLSMFGMKIYDSLWTERGVLGGTDGTALTSQTKHVRFNTNFVKKVLHVHVESSRDELAWAAAHQQRPRRQEKYLYAREPWPKTVQVLHQQLGGSKRARGVF